MKFKLLVRFSTRDFFFRGFLGSNCAAFNIDHISVDLFEKTLEEASISSSWLPFPDELFFYSARYYTVLFLCKIVLFFYGGGRGGRGGAVLIQVPFFREIYETSVNKLFTVVRQKPTHIFPYNFLKGATLYLRFIKQWNGETFN